MANKWINVLKSILDKSLQKYAPKSRIEDVELEKNKTFIKDRSERLTQRNTYQQQEYYRDKKGTHPIKNTLIINTLYLII
jgi:hypothetical protein